MTHGTASRAFLGGLVDYAGLFPPAALALEPALAEYARHRAGPDAWMLGRFVVPAARLEALASLLAADAALAAGGAWPLAVLVGAPDLEGALALLPAQADAVVACEQARPGLASVEGFELPLPPVTGAAGALAAALADEGLGGRDLWFEVGADVEAALDDIARAAAARGGPGSDFPRLGAKLRCGGVTAEAFPSVDRVVAVISGCAGRSLPLKFTAGLHHPVRHLAEQPPVVMHGFLNVVGAALLAQGGADPAVLRDCLQEVEPSAFTLDGAGFAWRGHAVPAASVAAARAHAVGGFGSCSFDEPRHDLATLGLPAD